GQRPTARKFRGHGAAQATRLEPHAGGALSLPRACRRRGGLRAGRCPRAAGGHRGEVLCVGRSGRSPVAALFRRAGGQEVSSRRALVHRQRSRVVRAGDDRRAGVEFVERVAREAPGAAYAIVKTTIQWLKFNHWMVEFQPRRGCFYITFLLSPTGV